MKQKIIIIGGGAAGFFTSIIIAENNPDMDITILEKGDKVLQKVKVSGGGRCNVTNACFTPQELVDKYFKIHKSIYEWFNCDFDCFGRTSSGENKEITIDIFEKLDKNRFIVENILQQPFCQKCDRFLSEIQFFADAAP